MAGSEGSSETFPLPHPEGEVYDPQGYRKLVSESTGIGRGVNWISLALFAILFVSCGTGIISGGEGNGFVVGGIATAAMVLFMVYANVRRAGYRTRLAAHELAVAHAKEQRFKGKNVTNTVTLNFSNGSRFTGPLVVGENINVSYSKIQNATGSDLRAALEALVKTSSQMIERLPTAEQKLNASEQLKTLTEQASKPQPSKWLLDVSGKGLIDAAKAVAEMSGPVATTVKAVLALLTGAA